MTLSAAQLVSSLLQEAPEVSEEIAQTAVHFISWALEPMGPKDNLAEMSATRPLAPAAAAAIHDAIREMTRVAPEMGNDCLM